jgi:hypothetical protein
MTSDQIQDFIGLLGERAGSYSGITENQAGQGYRTTLEIAPLADREGYSLLYQAGGLDGTVYFTEESTIELRGEEVDLLVPGASVKGMDPDKPVRFELRREEAADGSFRGFVFGFGDILDRTIFREEITIDLWENGDVGYRYAWGEPGEDLVPRTATRMKRTMKDEI